MKLVRYGAPGQERPGLIDAQDTLRDLSAHVGDIDAGALVRAGRTRLAALDPASLPEVAGTPRYGAPVAHVGKMICVGLNYSDHAAETGAAIPEQPILFMKATSAIMGPNDDVIIPMDSLKTDWEVELGVVIGDTARHVRVEDALNHVAGYLVVNDLSERAFQLEHGGQWTKGKGCDTFGPFGPYLVTLDEVGDLNTLGLWLDINGKRMQTGNTQSLIFDVPTLISYVSQFMSLQPGDVISTGTPPGVGLGMKPPVFLKEGDVIELGIDKLGSQKQSVKRTKI